MKTLTNSSSPQDGAADGQSAADAVSPPVLRRARREDVPALAAFEERVFATDRISARSFRDFVEKPSASLFVAEAGGALAGYALVLFRAGTSVARLYSIAVAPAFSRRGIARMMLARVEEEARDHGALFLRLEVRADNMGAITLYRAAGYREFGRFLDYYEDHQAALRLEKALIGRHPPVARSVPYFPQTTEFTCGPAAMAMAMAALDPGIAPTRALELTLWREATTIFMTSGHGGCEPVGMAVALKKRGFDTSVWLNQRPPLFLDGVRTPSKRAVMMVVQDTFREEAQALGLAIHERPLGRDDLVAALDRGLCAIVLISAWRMYHERYPHWLLVYGHDERSVFAHDPWIEPDEHETVVAKAHIAIPWPEFEAMSAYGRTRLRAAVLVGRERTA